MKVNLLHLFLKISEIVGLRNESLCISSQPLDANLIQVFIQGVQKDLTYLIILHSIRQNDQNFIQEYLKNALT